MPITTTLSVQCYNSQTSLPPEGIGAAVAADTTLARIKKNLQDCHDCVLDVLNQDTTTTVAVRRSTQQQQTFFYYISCCDLS